MERTFAIIKPDAVSARHAGRIIQRIEDAGFQIRAMRLVHLTQQEADRMVDFESVVEAAIQRVEALAGLARS